MKRLRYAIDFGCVAVPKAIGGASLLLLNVWLMAWLARESFGIYSLCVATFALLSEGLFGTAIDMAVLRLAPLYLETDTSRAIGIERAAVQLKIQVIAGASLLMGLGSSFLSRQFFHREGAAHLILLVCMASAAGLLLTSALLHLQVRSRFRLYGLLDSVNILLKYGGISLVLWLQPNADSPLAVASILVWFAVGPAVAVGLFFFFVDRSVFQPLSSQAQSRAELFGYLGWFLATLVISSLVARLDVFLLAAMGTIEEVGVFAGGQTIASIPILLGSYLAIVLNPKVMPYCRAGKFFELLRDVQTPMFIACIFIYSFVFYFRESLKAHCLPIQFADSADIILLLLPATLAGMTSYPLAISFLMFVSPRFLIRMECFLLPGSLVAYLVFIPQYGAWGAAVVTSALGLIKTVVAQSAAFHWARKSPTEMGLDLSQ